MKRYCSMLFLATSLTLAAACSLHEEGPAEKIGKGLDQILTGAKEMAPDPTPTLIGALYDSRPRYEDRAGDRYETERDRADRERREREYYRRDPYARDPYYDTPPSDYNRERY